MAKKAKFVAEEQQEQLDTITPAPEDLFVDDKGDDGLDVKLDVLEELIENEPPVNELTDYQSEGQSPSCTFAEKALGCSANDGIKGASRCARAELAIVLWRVKDAHDARPKNSVTDAKFNQIVSQTQKLNALIISFLNSK